MTEYKIVLYYEKPMPEFFQNSMEAMLKRGVEQGFISGYEFQHRELESGKTIKQTTLKDSARIKKEYEESLKDATKPIQDDTAGHDKPTEKRAEKLRREGEFREFTRLDKKVRSDKPDNRKKGR